MSHTSFVKVRGYHLDVYQHVNNARYLEFLEDARWQYLDETGDVEHFEKLGLAWVIVNINISYRSSAHMGQTLAIETKLAKVGTKSAVFNQLVTVKGTTTVVADADITFVVFDPKQNKAIPIEGELRERFSIHLAE